MSDTNTAVLITGCQRSGTTLLNLILDSHPDIAGIDEMEFDPSRFADYLSDSQYHPFVSFKLPTIAHEVQIVRQRAPTLKVLWCVRDPRDVVLSMISLKLGLSDTRTVSWANHPMGAIREIASCFHALREDVRRELEQGIEKYRAFEWMPPTARGKKEGIIAGALCWDIKNRLPGTFGVDGTDYHVVRYEDLVMEPQETIRRLLAYIGLGWHDNVLQHHRLHKGMSIGGTDNSAPINNRNTGKWAKRLTAEQLGIIKDICAQTAQKFDYTLQ
jgi:hypothetical protein